MLLNELRDYNASLLQTALFKDYCPNGVQVEGRAEVRRIATGVTASLQVLDEAIAWGADAILVHHGYFWRNEDATLVGIKKKRIAQLLRNDVSLLPTICRSMRTPNWAITRSWANCLVCRHRAGSANRISPGWGCWRDRRHWRNSRCRSRTICSVCRKPSVIQPGASAKWRGAAGGARLFRSGYRTSVDAYISGEISEQVFHLAQESGVAYIAAGHHATERMGIQALGAHLSSRFGLEHRFFDQANPI